MHELSLAQDIVEIIRQYVPEDRAGYVRTVKIKVGPLAGVVADSLDFCFGAIVGDTPLRHARLDIEATRLQSVCSACDTTFTVEGSSFLCPQCGSIDNSLVSGTELQVVEIELSDLPAGEI